MSLPHLIWVGHAGGITGLGRVAEQVLCRLLDRWRITLVSVLPLAHYEGPLTVIPGRFVNDVLGTLVTRRLCQDDPPALVCLNMDPGPTIEFLRHFPVSHLPIISYMPVDAENVRDGTQLNRLATAIFLSEFGRAQAWEYTGPTAVIGHGVDLEVYQPTDKAGARLRLGLPPHAFLFGNVGRNQPRKRFDLTLYAFREFLRLTHAEDGYLYCHCAPQADGWDLPQLAQYLGLQEHVLFPTFAPASLAALPEALMPAVYSALDVQITTTQGEGFSLCTLEGMACGVPQILPYHSALAEWPVTAAHMVEVAYPTVTTGCTNLVEWCVDYRAMAHAMRTLYESPAQRLAYAGLGYALAQQPQFRWDVIADQFHDVFEEVTSHAAVR